MLRSLFSTGLYILGSGIAYLFATMSASLNKPSFKIGGDLRCEPLKNLSKQSIFVVKDNFYLGLRSSLEGSWFRFFFLLLLFVFSVLRSRRPASFHYLRLRKRVLNRPSKYR